MAGSSWRWRWSSAPSRARSGLYGISGSLVPVVASVPANRLDQEPRSWAFAKSRAWSSTVSNSERLALRSCAERWPTCPANRAMLDWPTIRGMDPVAMTRRITATGSFTLPCDPLIALPLFTPEGERAWVEGWAPTYLSGATDEVGAVWTTATHSHTTWVTVVRTDDRVTYARVSNNGTAPWRSTARSRRRRRGMRSSGSEKASRSSYCCTSLLYGTKPAPPITSTGPLTWVGLSGLEPLTSSLSGKRSNRLSYRPGCAQRAE